MRNSKVTHKGPTTGVFAYWLGRLWMGICGWEVVGEIPDSPKFILVGAPHTSNWDFMFMLALMAVLRIRISWLGKASLFKGAMGVLMRRLGGIPVHRESRHGVVEQIAARFREAEQLVLVVAPAGTRGRGHGWKSGFYWMAYKAQVPIVCGALDYGRKQVRLGMSFVPSGDVRKDMDRIRSFFEGAQGKYPALASAITLSEEGGPTPG